MFSLVRVDNYQLELCNAYNTGNKDDFFIAQSKSRSSYTKSDKRIYVKSFDSADVCF